MNLSISLLEKFNVFLNILFNFSSILVEWFVLQYKHFYFIKLSLTLSYSGKQLQSLHLNLWIPSERLSTRFDNEFGINLALSKKFILYDKGTTLSIPSLSTFVISFLLEQKRFWTFPYFPQDFRIVPQNRLLIL